MKIALDSGHGETTGGKRSPDGSLREYEFNQDVTNRIKRHLERHGIEVFLTSPNPKLDPIIPERCRRANSAQADLFLSIHGNAAGDGNEWNEARGWEAYCMQKGGYEYKLAKCIYEESIPFLGVKDRGIKTKSFGVLTGTKMPAVLIEHGFYTNREECALMLTEAFREKCAVADAKGVLRYLGIVWVPETALVYNPLPEITEASSILWSLNILGIVPDIEGTQKIIDNNPNGRIYHLCQKVLKFIRDYKIDTLPEKQVAKLEGEKEVVDYLGPDEDGKKNVGIVTDKTGMFNELYENPKGTLYWVAYNSANYIHSRL